jgi:hypothetical protein
VNSYSQQQIFRFRLERWEWQESFLIGEAGAPNLDPKIPTPAPPAYRPVSIHNPALLFRTGTSVTQNQG